MPYANNEGRNQIVHLPSLIKYFFITKTRLFKYIENFTTKNWKFSDKILIFFKFLLKT